MSQDKIAEEWTGFVMRLLALPTRVAHVALGCSTFHEIKYGLQALVHEALHEITPIMGYKPQ